MIGRWTVAWLKPHLLELIRDEVDLYLADVEAQLLHAVERDQPAKLIGPAGSGAMIWKNQIT